MFEPQTPLAALNWDVLLHTVTFLSRRDVSLLMKTSHEFYELGLRQLFRDPVELRADNIHSLHGCLRLGTPFPRSHYLRDVTMTCSLSYPPPSSLGSMEQLFCDILQNASALRRLRLDWGAAGVSRHFAKDTSAFCNLEELHLPLVSQELWDNMKGLRAPIRKLTARFGPMHRFPAVDPITLLEPYKSTLAELNLAVVHCEDDSINYPNVQKLSLADCYYGLSRGGIDIGPVMRAFPDVVDFSLSASKVHPAVSHWKEGRCCDHADIIGRCRILNRQQQRESDGWTFLRSITVGHVVDLYMLGLCQAVPHVEIEAFSEGTMWMFQHVLSDTRPSHLTISFFARDYILDCLPGLIPNKDSTTPLIHLTLILCCDVPDIDVDNIITNLTDLLTRLPVERLSLRMRRWDTVGPYRLTQDGLLAIDAALDEVHGQVGVIASRLLDGVPSLRELTLTVAQNEGRWART